MHTSTAVPVNNKTIKTPRKYHWLYWRYVSACTQPVYVLHQVVRQVLNHDIVLILRLQLQDTYGSQGSC